MSHVNDMETLGASLEKLYALLSRHEVKYAEKLAPILLRINKGDTYGVDELLQYNGGMGSLNDVFICAENGHKIPKENEQTINKEYLSLLNHVWEIAKAIRAVK